MGKCWDVPNAINKRSWQSQPIPTYLQASDKKVLRCARTINNRFLQFLAIPTYLQARDKKELTSTNYDK